MTDSKGLLWNFESLNGRLFTTVGRFFVRRSAVPPSVISQTSSGTDEALTLTPPILHTLEQALEFIEDDELVEVTPNYIRLRKKFLKEHERKRASKNKES